MAKPVVDGLEQDMRDVMNVARIDVNSESGAEIASRYNITGVPAYVVLDARGNLLYRQVGGKPDVMAIKGKVRVGQP